MPNRRSFACHRRRVRQRGLTLLEVVMAVALVALLSGSLLFGKGMLAGSRTKAAATLIVTSVRFGLARANATGHPTRLVFDLDKKLLSIEESSGSVMLRVKGTDTTGGATPSTDSEQKARAEADRILEGPKPARPTFSKLSNVTGAQEELAAGRPLGDGVVLSLVQTEHDEVPLTDGRAYLYFWPGGTTERAVVQLHKTGDTEGMTVVVSPLTGRASIEKGKVNLPEPRGFDQDVSEREEP